MGSSRAGRVPRYARLAELIRAEIGRGDHAVSLPSYRSLMRTHDVALVTVRRALDILEAEGLVERIHGSGTYVRGDAPPPVSRRECTRTICYLSGSGTEITASSFFARVMVAAQRTAEDAGYVQVFASPRDERLPLAIARGQVDGVVLGGTYNPHRGMGPDIDAANERYLSRLGALGIPVVAINNHAEAAGVHRVLPDYAGGCHALLRHLLELGHRRVTAVGGPLAWPAFDHRARLLRHQAAAMGLTLEVHDYPTHDYLDPEGARAAVAAVLDATPRPTALVVFSGVLDKVLDVTRARGLDIPRDLSLVTFADHQPATLDTPPMTCSSLVIPADALGAAGVRLLTELLDDGVPPRDLRPLLLPLDFVPGATSSRPPGRNRSTRRQETP